jgi:hypothetical protein
MGSPKLRWNSMTKERLQTVIIVILTAIIVTFVMILGLYAVSDNFRWTFDAIFKPEQFYKYSGSDGTLLPLPPHTTSYYQQPKNAVSYYSMSTAEEVLNYYKKIANPHTFEPVQTKSNGRSYTFNYSKNRYILYFYSTNTGDHTFMIQIE